MKYNENSFSFTIESTYIHKELILIYSFGFLFVHVFENMPVLKGYPNIGSVKTQLLAISQNVCTNESHVEENIICVTRERVTIIC